MTHLDLSVPSTTDERVSALLEAVKAIAQERTFGPVKTLPGGAWGAFDPSNAVERGRRLHAENYSRLHWLLSMYAEAKALREAGAQFAELDAAGAALRKWCTFHWSVDPKRYDVSSRSLRTKIANHAAWQASGAPMHLSEREAAE